MSATTGILLPNGCRVTHGEGANVKRPFADIPLVMHELSAGDEAGRTIAYHGQFGFIPFNDQMRLPRHVHLNDTPGAGGKKLLWERILVLNGVGLTELNGEVFLVAPGTLVDIAPGIPHTWTACPAGVPLPDGSTSDGTFLMIYEYPERTAFFPIERTTPIRDVSEYRRFEGDLEAIRFPKLTAQQVVDQTSFVWDREHRRTADTRARA